MPYALVPSATRTRDTIERYHCEAYGWPIHDTKAAALAGRTVGYTVRYVLDYDERDRWQTREYVKLTDGTYTALPDWFPRAYAEYAHLAPGKPGSIRYTPDDAAGHEDRQTTTTAGRYLERLIKAGLLSKTQAKTIPYLVDRLRRHADGSDSTYIHPYTVATSADDIARIYYSGPASCMDRRNFSNWRESSPVRQYAGGDLAFAYIGTIGATPETDQILARAVVWPDRKLYGRIYPGPQDGYAENRTPASLYFHAALRAALERDGWSPITWAGFAGARIPYAGGPFPYVDWHLCASESADQRWLILTDCGKGSKAQTIDDQGRTYNGLHACTNRDPHKTCTHNVQQTSGVAARTRYRITCQHCQTDTYSARNAGYCDACLAAAPECSYCGERHPGETLHTSTTGARYCADCWRRHQRPCEYCGDRFQPLARDPQTIVRSTRACDPCNRRMVQCQRHIEHGSHLGWHLPDTTIAGFGPVCRTCVDGARREHGAAMLTDYLCPIPERMADIDC